MPDQLFTRAKQLTAKRGITFRALVVDALEQAMDEKPSSFILRDAAAGYSADKAHGVSSADINRAIDESRERIQTP